MLGRVSGLFGVKGWVKVFSYTQPREAILDYDRWYVKRQGEWQAAAISEGKRHGKTVIARLDGIDDRDAAATRVAYLMETGANDVLVIQGEHERLIPFVADKVILDVDLDNGVISVDWDWD